MADHNLPTTASTYTSVIDTLNAKISDVAVQFNGVTLTNPPTNTVRWNNSTSLWEKNTGTPAAPVWSALAATYGINISGNAATATSAATLTTARTINGVSFNGSTNITITANTPTTVTFNNGGAGGASGSTFNGGTALTVSYNTVGAPSVTGSGASGTWGINISGSAATAAYASTAGTAFAQTLLDDTSLADARVTLSIDKLAVQSVSAVTADTTIRGGLYSATGNITIPASVFAAGDILSVYNNSAASIGIVQGASITLRQAGTANTGNRTLLQRGLCSILFLSATEAIISGAGVS